MFMIKFKQTTDTGIDYIGTVDVNVTENQMRKCMEYLCDEMSVSIFWQLSNKGNFFISIDFCEAKICSGGLYIE